MTGKLPAGFAVRPDADGFVVVVLPDFLWHIAVQVIDVDGVPQLTGLRLEWMPVGSEAVITSDRLRRLPLRTLVELGAAANVSDAAAAGAVMRRHVDTWPQGRARPAEHFEEVAAVYRAATQNRRPPLKDIQVRWKVSRAMASKYVRRARELGYLGAAKTGVAGEVTKRKAEKP